VAKSGKGQSSRDRRALVEEMRKQQRAAERRRTLVVVAACAVVAIIIVVVAAIPLIKQKHKEQRDLSSIGVAKSAAGCQPIKTKDADGSGVHKDPGTPIDYPDNPPAYGPHWGNYLQGAEIRNQYAVQDRPPVERLVHSLEHGYSILWYDETIGKDKAAMDDLSAIADKYPLGDRLIIAPWTKDDGGAFPDGTHVSLTHWTGPDNQTGVWEYCKSVSGPVVGDFTDKYPSSDAPEPGAA
jgi:Protein of unknown function (DUF3105)